MDGPPELMKGTRERLRYRVVKVYSRVGLAQVMGDMRERIKRREYDRERRPRPSTANSVTSSRSSQHSRSDPSLQEQLQPVGGQDVDLEHLQLSPTATCETIYTGEIDYAELATAAGTVATSRQQVLLLHHETRCPVALGFPADNFQMIDSFLIEIIQIIDGEMIIPGSRGRKLASMELNEKIIWKKQDCQII
ncbi:uncharacterized protein LOC134197078 [Corticium candelabrum]|uniref:uncharacterized protein LOC134197078 n=1 Tax=Corticium candelabrum TaxID=121492 RepID=UPI002E25347A|nr:uncharacterized protein LOC134197078 [Corticium candelabrum]